MKKSILPRDFYKQIAVQKKTYTICHLPRLKKMGFGDPGKLPFSIKVLLESAIRNLDHFKITVKDIENILSWSPRMRKQREIAFKPGRVVLQDFTGVPCVVDLAAMRSGMQRLGGDIRKINPQVPCDLVIDHSVQIDSYGSPNSFHRNISLEFKRNKERYQFLKWGQNAFKNFRVVPPATGIIHQINLEYFAKGVMKSKVDKRTFLYPDSLVGTDSHTTMINGLGIVGWGVGGIEAEAVMLGEPINMLLPEVVGCELKGQWQEGVTATDLVLTVVERLREKGVVGKFVEFYGEGLQYLSLPDRATLSNMGPEYGATIGIFPVDEKTLEYYKLTGRTPIEIKTIQTYMEAQGLFAPKPRPAKEYSDHLCVDVSRVVPSVAGPKRPQDRINLTDVKDKFNSLIADQPAENPSDIDAADQPQTVKGDKEKLAHGSVVIASITSCTNTSNPTLMIAAGLIAKKAVEKGLRIKKYVKTSFIPGSQVVTEYLTAAGLIPYLEKLRFHIVGYGCGPCIGNSGPLPAQIVKAIEEKNLTVASVLSGNRNFEGRISPHTKTNFLASPPLVIAFALAGTMRIDFQNEPIGRDLKGGEVFLKDLWPTQKEIDLMVDKCVTQKSFKSKYQDIYQGDKHWAVIKGGIKDLFHWHKSSTYIQEPPFFTTMSKEPSPIQNIAKAQVLVKVGDSITTDHISPAGVIKPDSPAGQYLQSKGIEPKDFNSYGSRRGNDQVMTRGTFANIRLKNQLAPETEGSWTTYFPENKQMSIYDAAVLYKQKNIPLIVIAGKEYGTGSSRDWAAKGTALLGVKVVIAESYERIHRSNLAGMGVLPLEFLDGKSATSLGLQGDETFDFDAIDDNLKPRQIINVIATSPKGGKTKFKALVRLETPVEIDYFRHGGILQTVLRKLLLK